MKALKVMSVLLFIISAAVLGLFIWYQQQSKDETPPVIQYEAEEIKVGISVTEKELLADVTATDNKSGDISDKVVIENISSFIDKNTRVIRYAVIDEQGNVARAERNLIYTDYQAPRFTLERSMRFPTGKTFQILQFIKAQSAIDGDLTEKIKYEFEKQIDVTVAGTYNVEFRVMDTAGEVSYLPVTIELYDRSLERVTVHLKEYLVYVPQGTSFDPAVYYESASVEDGELAIQSSVNVNEPGVYTVDYTVQSEGMIGKNRLMVVVTE